MIIQESPAKLHWNYFLALERDLEVVSRYVEFSEPNFGVYSIELAHLLFAAASEVDVVAKLICKHISPTSRPRNIDGYKAILLPNIHGLSTKRVSVPRFGLHFTPWKAWSGDGNPIWWRRYNNVKHKRDSHFHEATLKNALNALGALQILTFHLYWQALRTESTFLPSPAEATAQLQPPSILMRLDEDLLQGR